MRLEIKRAVKIYMRDGCTGEKMIDEIIDIFKEEMYEAYKIRLLTSNEDELKLEFEKWYQQNYKLPGTIK